ncbi:MAG: tyrosine-type recombinase/integrase [Bacteroidota bacterium]
MLSNFLKYLEFEKRSSHHTVAAYQEDLRQFADYLYQTFEISSLEEAKHTHLRGWIVDLVQRGLSPTSINRKIACLKSFYKYLRVRGAVEDNPASRLKPLKVEKRLPTFLRESEVIDLLDHVHFDVGSFHDVRDKLLLELLYASGIRLSELIGLKISDFDEFDQNIKVLGKRSKERIIPLPDFIVKVLKSYLVLRSAEFPDAGEHLLLTDKGDMLYPMFVYRTVKKYVTLVSTLTKKSPHVLRHTFATHLLDKGADLNAVKDLLGHSSLAATQVYTHNSLEKLKSVFDQAHPKA